MKYKLFCAFLYLTILSTGNTRAQWIQVKSPVTSDLHAICFTDMHCGWIVGNDGTILKYTGNSWSKVPSPTGRDLYSVTMLSNDDGWITGEKGTILHFNGKQWDQVNSPTEENLYAVEFSDPFNGIAVGAKGVILRFDYSDWKLAGNDKRFNFYTVSLKNRTAWIGGNSEGVKVPIIQMETNLEVEQMQNFNIGMLVNSIFFHDESEGWAVGSTNQMLHYNGNSWDQVSVPEKFSSLRSVYFEDKNNGMAAGYSGNILLYENGNWVKEKSITNQHLNAVSIIKGNYFAIGNNGTIVTKNSDEETYSPLLSVGLAEITLFPNPCDLSINLGIGEDEKTDHMHYFINNIVGQTVASNNFELSPGKINYPIATADLDDGIYYLTITKGDKVETRQFIVLHNK